MEADLHHHQHHQDEEIGIHMAQVIQPVGLARLELYNAIPLPQILLKLLSHIHQQANDQDQYYHRQRHHMKAMPTIPCHEAKHYCTEGILSNPQKFYLSGFTVHPKVLMHIQHPATRK
eukprot:4908928-Ditylum_brightwellii.AAC.1